MPALPQSRAKGQCAMHMVGALDALGENHGSGVFSMRHTAASVLAASRVRSS